MLHIDVSLTIWLSHYFQFQPRVSLRTPEDVLSKPMHFLDAIKPWIFQNSYDAGKERKKNLKDKKVVKHMHANHL